MLACGVASRPAPGMALSPSAGRRPQRFRVDLAVGSWDSDELGAAREELRSAALVMVDMAVGVREHAAPRRGEGGQAQAVGGRPGADREDLDVPLEDLAEP